LGFDLERVRGRCAYGSVYLRIFPGKGRATEIAVARANSVKLAAYSTNQHINNYYVRNVRFVAFQ
jgi:hypothetical protein